MGSRGSSSPIKSGKSAGKIGRRKTDEERYEDLEYSEEEYENLLKTNAQKYDAWLESKESELTTDGGFVYEKFKNIKDAKTFFDYADGVVDEDDSWAIRYKDGSTRYLMAGDETTGVKFTNIDSIIYENASTTIVYGKNIYFYNDITHKEYKKGYNQMWRVDFYTRRK